jgi:hypothetical protein
MGYFGGVSAWGAAVRSVRSFWRPAGDWRTWAACAAAGLFARLAAVMDILSGGR